MAMNSFWDFVDWILPPVRIIDDLAEPAESIHRSRSNNHSSHGHHSHRQHGSSPQVTRRTSARDFDKERERERERRKTTRVAEYEREREQYRLRIQHLERENDALREQLKATREELANLTVAVFPPTPERTLPPSPLTPLDSSQPSALASPSTHLQVTPIVQQPSTSSNSAEAALSDPKRLRVLYTALRTSYSDARQTILSQAEELASLKSFLSKTDDWSGAQLLQALADLNSEILQLAASVAEEFSPALRAHEHAPSAAKERDREVVERALGPTMIRLLEDRMHAGDPTLVQFALQAWEVWCVARVLDAFCFGLPAEVDEAFRRIFEHMYREEPQPTTSRWRALTYKHAHTLLARHRASPSDPPTPDSPVLPAPFASAPASLASSSTLAPPLLSLTERNLRGVLAILALAGCTDARGLHRDPLRTRFGGALSRISARAERIAGVVRTGVMSGLFEMVWVPPPARPPLPKSGRSSVAEGAAVVGAGKSKGKEREREWVQEVERERRASRYGPEDDPPAADAGPKRAGADSAAEGRWFDWETMENVYAGYGSERCRVLCTVELGLAFRRRLAGDDVTAEGAGEGESVDGDGMPRSRPTSSASRVASAADAPGVRADAEEGEEDKEMGESGIREERTLLLKPKVLLESVTEFL